MNKIILADMAIKYLFPNQEISETFRKSFRDYVKESYSVHGCDALYIAEDPLLTVNFRNFMRKFPELDCGKREVILTEKGGVIYKNDYHNHSSITVLE